MKKILAIILALACTLTLFACKKDDSIESKIASVEKMYENSAPTKIVTHIDNKVGSRVYEAELTFVKGKIGSNAATVYTYWEDQFRDVASGSGPQVVGPVNRVSGSEEYLEGSGYRVNGGRWDDEGTDFAPARGDVKIDLTLDYLIDPKYENDVLSFSVAPENASKVFGTILDNDLEDESITENISVSVSNAGTEISGITISYIISGGDDYPDIEVTVTSVYTYDLEEITLTK